MKKVIAFKEKGKYRWTPDELGYNPDLHWSLGEVIEVPERIVKKGEKVEGEAFYIYYISQFISEETGTVARVVYDYFCPF